MSTGTTTYFVTGGEGFVGYHLCRELCAREGSAVVTYDAGKHWISPDESVRPAALSHRRETLGDAVTRVRGDTTKRAQVRRALADHRPDVVVNLAALPLATVSNERPTAARENILDGTMTLVDAVAESDADVDRVVQVSSSMVYGDFDVADGSVVPASEDDDCAPKGVYGALKLSAEHVVRSYARRHDVESVVVRPSAVYGPTDCNRRVTELFLRRALRGDPLRLDNGGDQELDFTYVTDLARGLVLASTADAAAGETFNLTRGEGRTVRELAEVIGEHVPGTETYVAERERTRPRRGTLDVSKARRLLGYDPQYSLEEGMARYVEFLRETGFDEVLAR